MREVMEVVENKFKETEIGLIPEDWEVVRLGEVAEISSGGSAPQGKEYFRGNNPFIRVQHLDNDNYIVKGCDYITDEAVKKYKLKLFPKDTIIFPKSGASIYLEKRAKLPFDAYIVSHLMAVRSKSHLLLQDYLFFNLVSKKLSKDKADNYPTLNISEVSQIPILLPPLEEQKAIADILSTVQNVIEKTEKVIDATKQLKKSMMKHLFTYGAVAVDEIDRVKLKETEIGLIPEHWEVVRLGEVFEVKQGKQLSSKESKEGKTLKPFLRTSNILWNRIDTSNLSYMPFSDKEFEVLKLCKGDILVCEGGDVGRTAVWEGQLEECAYQNHLHRLRPKENNIINYFFSYWMEYAISLRRLYISIANKTTIPNLSSQRLKSFSIPLPPLDEQQKIANILTTIDQKIQAEEKKKEALQNLFKHYYNNL
jgi:Restriction endonuclease S subunits